MSRAERVTRVISVVVCELAVVATIIMLLLPAEKELDRLLLAFVTLLLVLVPEFVERIFRCRISLPVYLFALFYAIGAMLGHCHKFYYLISWWDKMLHVFGGVMFALLGLYLFERFSGADGKRVLFAAIFSLCFSMAVAVLWEFVEFGADRFLGMDMQDDTIITSITSYLLGESMGVTGTITDIWQVTVNGQPLPGYIDIGLLDTMTDMLLETLGALVVAGYHLMDRGRHPAITPREPERRKLG